MNNYRPVLPLDHRNLDPKPSNPFWAQEHLPETFPRNLMRYSMVNAESAGAAMRFNIPSNGWWVWFTDQDDMYALWYRDTKFTTFLQQNKIQYQDMEEWWESWFPKTWEML